MHITHFLRAHLYKPYTYSKEPYTHSKEPCTHSKEPYICTHLMYITHCDNFRGHIYTRPTLTQKSPTHIQKSPTHTQKSHTYVYISCTCIHLMYIRSASLGFRFRVHTYKKSPNQFKRDVFPPKRALPSHLLNIFKVILRFLRENHL